MGVLFLHGINVIFETVMTLWIAGAVFSKRENCGSRHILSELVGTAITLEIVPHNFLVGIYKNVWRIAVLILIIILFYYRVYIEGRERIQSEYIKAINKGIIILQLGMTIGILIWNGWLFYISTAMVLVGNFPMLFLLYCYFRCSFFQAYILELLCQGTIHLLKNVYMVSEAMRANMNVADAVKSGRFHQFPAIIYVTFVLLILFWFIRKLSVCKLLKEFMNRHVFILFAVGMIEFLVLNWLTDLGLDGFDSRDFEVVLLFTLIVALVLLFIIIRIYVNLIESEKRLLDVRNAAIEQQYEELQAAYRQNRCLIHDQKHMIQYLLECLENNKVHTAIDFVKKYQRDIAGQSRHSWTGISTLDFIINMKKRRMDRSDIEFTVKAELENLPMEDTDFVVLLGNLLDNAIEAAEKCEVEKREIHLFIKNVNDMFLLQMINSSNVMPQQKLGRFVTSKMQKEKHGLGIESVRRIVEKYNGSIDFQYDQTIFQVKLICSMS